MTRNSEERGRSSSTSSSASSSKKTDYASRSPSQVQYLENSDEPQRTQRSHSITFQQGAKNEQPQGRKPRQIETPQGPIDRPDTLESLGSLSQQTWPQNQDANEPTWPTDWRAYTCLFGGFLLMFNSWGLVNAYGTYSSFYMQELLAGQDLLLLNLVGSTQSGVVLALSAVVGRFLDAGHIRVLLIIGTVFIALGMFLLSVVNGDGGYQEGNYPYIWLTQGLLTGLGMACFFVSSSQVVSTWFKAKKSFAIGIVASGASIAGLLYPMMLKFLIDDIGFNDAERAVAGLTTATCVLAIFIARPNPAHELRGQKHWKDWFDTKIFWDTAAFREPAYAFLVAAIAFLFFGFYAVFFNLEEWAITKGFGTREPQGSVGDNDGIPDPSPDNQIETFWLLSIMNASSTIGRLGSAYLCDRLGALNVHAFVTTVASLLVLFLWTFTETLPPAIAFVVIFGAFSGAVIGLPPASVAYVLGPDRQSKLGQWTGMMYTCAAVFALTGPVIAGHLISHYSTFLTVQLWSGISMLLSAICMCCGVYFRRRKDKLDRLNRVPSSAPSWGTAVTEKQDV